MRPQLDRNFDHLGERRHFLIEMNLDGAANPEQIVVLDMAAVFAQVNGYRGGPRALRRERELDWIRIRGAPRLTQGRDVVDIHAELGHSLTV